MADDAVCNKSDNTFSPASDEDQIITQIRNMGAGYWDLQAALLDEMSRGVDAIRERDGLREAAQMARGVTNTLLKYGITSLPKLVRK